MKIWVISKGEDRYKTFFVPECLDDYIDEENPIRIIDAFVNFLNLEELSFRRVKPANTGYLQILRLLLILERIIKDVFK